MTPVPVPHWSTRTRLKSTPLAPSRSRATLPSASSPYQGHEADMDAQHGEVVGKDRAEASQRELKITAQQFSARPP